MEIDDKVELLLRIHAVELERKLVQEILDSLSENDRKTLKSFALQRVNDASDTYSNTVIEKYIKQMCDQEVAVLVRKHFEESRATLDKRVGESFKRYLQMEYIDKVVDNFAPEPLRTFVREKVQAVLKTVRGM